MAGIVEILGTDVVVSADGKVVNIEDILKNKTAVGIYFSAHWCPPCRGFTPILKDFYNENKEKFECIFVSSDRDENAFKEYFFEEMTWHAMEFSRRDLKDKVSSKYKVTGIPTLIILRPDGTTITTHGRGDVVAAKDKDWKFPEW